MKPTIFSACWMRRFLLLLLALIVAACGGNDTSDEAPNAAITKSLATATAVPSTATPEPTITPSPTPEPAVETLSDLLAFVPEYHDLISVEFRSWELLKRYNQADDLTGQSSEDEKRAFFEAAADDALTFLGCGEDCNPNAHFNNWGWDELDVLWDLELFFEYDPPVRIYKFPPDYNFTAVIALYEERGFEHTSYQTAEVYSHEFDLNQEWARGGFLFHNVIIPDEQLLITSNSDTPAFQAVLDAYYDNELDGPVNETISVIAADLGSVAAALLIPDYCESSLSHFLTVSRFFNLEDGELTVESSEAAELLNLDVEEFRSLRLFNALGMGYRYEGDTAVGTYVLAYDTAESAAADLDARTHIIERTTNPDTMEPLYQPYFTLDEAEVSGNHIVLHVQPAENRPAAMFDFGLLSPMWLFAACP